MPAISISSVDFVRAILEGRKTSTIRPLFRPCGKCDGKRKFVNADTDELVECDVCKGSGTFISKPRLKVNDIVKLYYKMRSTPKDSWSCLKCGSFILLEARRISKNSPPKVLPEHIMPNIEKMDYSIMGLCTNKDCLNNSMKKWDELTSISTRAFPKHFKTVKITEVFEIEMGYGKGKFSNQGYIEGREGGFDNHEIAKRDGFDSTKEMFNWFNKAYSLDSPKRFAVYRWGKLES